MQNGGPFRGPAGVDFLHPTSKFWSRGPYRGPHWSCSKQTSILLTPSDSPSHPPFPLQTWDPPFSFFFPHPTTHHFFALWSNRGQRRCPLPPGVAAALPSLPSPPSPPSLCSPIGPPSPPVHPWMHRQRQEVLACWVRRPWRSAALPLPPELATRCAPVAHARSHGPLRVRSSPNLTPTELPVQRRRM
jgi:hypothetical protein